MRTLSVLIADDERVIVDGFSKLVNWQGLGCEICAVAYDGMLAVSELIRIKPDLAIIDINMPLLSGLDVIRRAAPECSGTVFIIISGYDDFKNAHEALKLRVRDYLLKPVDFGEFESLILSLRRELFDQPEFVPPSREAEAELPLINRIVAYINDHFSEELNLRELSGKFFMNPAYLSQYFKGKTGMNYYTYLSGLRIERAKQLLSTTDKSISDIAQAVGMKEYRTFTKLFHRAAGISPSEYRKSLARGPGKD